MRDFQFHRWSKSIGSDIEARTIELPEEFVAYLESDGVQYPRDGNFPYTRPADGDYDDSDAVGDSEDDESSCDSIPAGVHDILQRIDDAIMELGGCVFPKLNWSSPRDAYWILGSLECRRSADVLLLLKSSDFIVHDLEAYRAGLSGGDSLYLVLRKWISVNPAMEFRCFVRQRQLIGISQRDFFNYYPFLESIECDIRRLIIKFWHCTIEPSTFSPDDYVVDIYYDDDRDIVRLIDINPFDPERTDPLLFDWEELAAAARDNSLQFRIVRSQLQANSTAAPRFAISQMPLEATVLSNGSTIAEFAQSLNQNIIDAMY